MPQLPRVDSIDLICTPDIDEFVQDIVPDICINQDNCIKHQSTGSFLSLIRRKALSHLNEKYLISMAERRGLFGKPDRDKSKSKAVKLQEINEPPPPDATYDNSSATSRAGGQHAVSHLESTVKLNYIVSEEYELQVQFVLWKVSQVRYFKTVKHL